MNSDSSTTLQITNAVYNIELGTSNQGPSANVAITITALLKSDDGSIYTGTSTVILTDSSNSISGILTATTSTGTCVFTVHFLSSGIKTITVSTGYVNQNLVITVASQVLKIITFTPVTFMQPTISTDVFSITIGVYDNSVSTLENINGPYSITISLPSPNKIYGTLTGNTVSGIATFSGLRVLSAGTFKISAFSSGKTSADSVTFTVQNYLFAISAVIDSLNPTVNFEFSVIVSLTGEDLNYFTSSCDVSLTSNNDAYLHGDTFITTSNGVAIFKMYISKSLQITLTFVSSSFTTVLTFDVAKQVLKISSPSPTVIFIQPILSSDEFSVTVRVYHSHLPIVETVNGPYTISISPSDSGVLLGVSSSTTANGEAVFSGLRLISNGNFTITSTSENIVSGSTPTFSITNVAYSLEITTETSTVTSGFFFQLTVTIKGEDTKLFMNPATVVISASDTFWGDNSINTSTGAAVFTIYFNTVGYKEITATCNSIKKVYGVAVTASINPDPLCVVPESKTTCSKCVSNAYVSGTSCQCIENSVFSSTTKICECIAGAVLNNGLCATCKNYYANSELSGKYSTDFKTIILTFTRMAATFTISKCTDVLFLPDGIADLKPSCYWSNSITFNIVFAQIPSLSGVVIGVDPYKVLAKGSVCSTNIENLNVQVINSNKIPTPDSSINAPDTFSLSCSARSLLISAAVTSSNLTYQWSATVTSANKALEAKISEITSNILKLVPSDLYLTTLKVTLKVTNSVFLTSSKSSKSIIISSQDTLQVLFNTGNAISIKSSQPLSISAEAAPCSSNMANTIKYTWTYASSSILDFNSILQSSSRKNAILLPSNTLESGSTYTFTLSVTDGTLSGTGNVIVTVISSSLEITLSRSNGQASSTRDLSINSIVVDPDNQSAQINYAWSCYEATEICKDSSGYYLIGTNTLKSLLIPAEKLKPASTYIFTLTATTSDKTGSKTIEIYINSTITQEIQIDLISGKARHDISYYIIPKITASESAEFVWILTSSTSESIITSSYSYFEIPAFTLEAGELYQISLVLTDGGNIMNTTTVLACNAPAVCDGISLTLTGDVWTINMDQCIDGDNEDYPLVYQYSIVDNEGDEYWATLPVYNSQVDIKIFRGYTKIIGKVCDSLGDCNSYSTDIGSGRRQLGLITDFDNDITNPDNTPFAIIAYLKLLQNAEEFLHIYDTFYAFFSAETFDTYTIDLFISCVQAIYSVKEYATVEIIIKTTEFISAVVESYNATLTYAQVSKIIQVSSEFASEIDPNTGKMLLDTMSKFSITDQAPTTSIILNNEIHYIRCRLHGKDIKSFKAQNGKFKIKMPSDLDIHDLDVYEIYYFQYLFNGFDLSQLKLYRSGTYENSTLSLQSPAGISLNFASPVTILLLNPSSDLNKVQCTGYNDMNWTTKFCEIADDTILLYSPGIIAIRSSEQDNLLRKICIYSLYGIFLLGCVICVLLFLYDRKETEEISKKKGILLLIPISSLMVKQAKHWRFLVMGQILATEAILMALTGGFIQYFHKSISFTLTGLLKLLIPLAITQIFSMFIFNVNFSYLKQGKVYYYSLSISLFFTLASTIAILIFSFSADLNISFYWLITYCCLLFCDLFLIHPLYAWVLSKRNQDNNIQVFSMRPITYDDSPVKIISMDENSPQAEISISRDETILVDRSLNMSQKAKEAKNSYRYGTRSKRTIN